MKILTADLKAFCYVFTHNVNQSLLQNILCSTASNWLVVTAILSRYPNLDMQYVELIGLHLSVLKTEIGRHNIESTVYTRYRHSDLWSGFSICLYLVASVCVNLCICIGFQYCCVYVLRFFCLHTTVLLFVCLCVTPFPFNS